MSERGLELRLLRQEIAGVRVLLERLEARVAALEEEDRFEVVYHEGPSSPAPSGSGGVHLSRTSIFRPAYPRPGSGAAPSL